MATKLDLADAQFVGLLTKIKYAFAHQAIIEGLQLKKEHIDRLAEIAVRLCNEHCTNINAISPKEPQPQLKTEKL